MKTPKKIISVQIWFVDEMFNSWPNDLFGTNVDKTHESRWYELLAIL